MSLLVILYLALYLIVSYLSIYRFNMKITQILRIIFGIGIFLFLTSAFMFLGFKGYLIISLVFFLIANVEITAFKHSRNDQKALLILNMFTVAITLLIIISSFVYL